MSSTVCYDCTKNLRRVSVSQSFSGKICPDCSNSYFVLNNSKENYTSSGSSIQSDIYKCHSIQSDIYMCQNCGLKIIHRLVREIPNKRKLQGWTLAGNPLSNFSVERKSNPLRI